MKETLATMALMALIVAFAPIAWVGKVVPASPTQTPALTDSPAQPRMSNNEAIEGKIKSLDKSGESVTLEDGTTLTIPDSLKAARAILKEGAMLRATYQEKRGEKVATSLDVQPTATKPKS